MVSSSEHASSLTGYPSLLTHTRLISKSASIIVAGVGFTVLVGWIFDIAELKSIAPWWVTMKANTAIAFILTGTTLFLSLGSRVTAMQRSAGLLSTMCIISVSVLTLCEYSFGRNLGIDEIIFKEPKDAIATSSPGRMAPLTAVNFLAIGLSFLIRKKWGILFIHFVFAVSLLGFIGYLYGVESFYGNDANTSMALHTSLTFMIAAIGLLFSKPDSSLIHIVTSDTAGGIVARTVLPSAIITLIMLGWLRLVGQRMNFYDVNFGVASFTFIYVIFFTFLLWRIALQLHRLDTDRSKAEDDRRNLLNDLEQRVRERTEELSATNAQLLKQIDERVQAELNTHKAETRYKTTLDHMMEGCQIIGSDWRYVYINDAAELHNRRPKEELIGKKYMEMWPGIESTEVFRIIRRCMEDRIPHQMENEFRFPDGTVGWFKLSIEPVPEGVFILSQDITKERLLDKELQLHREHLEELVIERTAQLKEANKELEAFSYSVSHDLRAPLRHINGFVDLLLKHTASSLDEKNGRYLNIIASSAKEMGTLIDELLVFSRMARVEMHATSIDMRKVVDELIRRMEKETEQRSIKWNVGELPSVVGDLSMLRLVFQNLLENAVKYTRPRETPLIEIGSSVRDKEFVFFVRDNGVGFDMMYKDKLFGVFQRLHSASEFEGTGIGLANVRRIILRHGGNVWAESEIDKGSTFYFSLPIPVKG